MKIALKKNQIVFLTVRAPKSGEVFTVPLELEDTTSTTTTQAYDNFQEEKLKEVARAEIRAAVQKLKNPLNYGPNEGYSNIAAHQWGIGCANPARAEERKQKGFV